MQKFDAIRPFYETEFNDAINKFSEINNAGFQNRHINFLFVKSLFLTQQYKKALTLLLSEEKTHLLNFEELNLTGQCYGFLDDIENSKKYFKKALKKLNSKIIFGIFTVVLLSYHFTYLTKLF